LSLKHVEYVCVLLSKKKIVKDHLPLKVVVIIVVQLEIAKQDGIIVVVIVNLTVTKIQGGSGELDSRL
jgi:hypothetical protein